MSTRLQEKLADEIIKDAKNDQPLTALDLLLKVGFAENTAKHKQSEILRNKGLKEALQRKGFTIEGADSVVEHILYKGKREETKLKAAEMVYKRLGANAPDKSISLSVNIGTLDPKEIELAEKYEAELKQELNGELPESPTS